MKIFLTGSTGFLGRHLLDEMLLEGHEVIILLKNNSTTLFGYEGKAVHKVYTESQFNLDQDYSILDGCDAIVHAATSYGESDTDFWNPICSNLLLPIHLMELLTRFTIPKFINIDSFFRYYPEYYPYMQGYRFSKNQFRNYATNFVIHQKISFVNLVLYHLYGPNDSPNKFLPALIRKCLIGEDIELTSAKNYRDFLHVDDCVGAILMTLKLPATKMGYVDIEVGSGSMILMKDAINMIHGLCNSKSKLKFGAIRDRYGEISRSASISSLQAIGWEPEYSFYDGIRNTINSIKNSIEPA
jgi:nucleoside-diphosphate-sugar epimerase